MPCFLYSDASIKPSKNNTYHAYIGGMITDEQGKILFSFFDKIYHEHGFKCSHIDYAEAVAMEIGLMHANDMGIKDIICFTDSRNCVEAIQNFQFNLRKEGLYKQQKIIQRIPQSHKKKHTDTILDIIAVGEEFFNTFEVKHIVRKKNQYADNMSNYLRILDHGDTKEKSNFKQMLRTSLQYACEYDYIEEYNAYAQELVSLRKKMISLKQ